MPSAKISEFLLDTELTFLNHGSFGACPRVVLDTQTELRERLERDPVRFLASELESLLDAARNEAAAFVDADPEDFVFVRNATSAVNTVLGSFPLTAGDELLLTSHGYAACRNAAEYWATRSGARVIEARLPWPVPDEDCVVQAVRDAITPRTRLALLDHVTSPSALVLPIERLVRELQGQGVPVLVDGAHAPGQLPLSVRRVGADYYTGNFHKWCCSPKAAAFLVATPNRMPALRPLVVSHGASAERPERPRAWLEFDWLGTEDPTAYLAVPRALAFLQQVWPGGFTQLLAQNHALAFEARELLCARIGAIPSGPKSMMGAMATLILPGSAWPSPELLYEKLLAEHRIQVPIFTVPGQSERALRVSAHVYNSRDDYERLADALTVLAPRGLRQQSVRLPEARGALVDEFLLRACLSYAGDDFAVKWQRAARILARCPELATVNLFTAVVAGETDAVRRALAKDAKLASVKGGPQNWEPLLFVCYGRLPTEKAAASSLEIARLLLEAGADANAHFVLGGGNEACRFTALTGAMGQGELGQPEHPHAHALARLLLQHGADPNDSQGLYDTCLLGDDVRWLELLASYGLNQAHQANWNPQTPLAVFDFLLAQAATIGQTQRARWLLEHGANPDARSTYTAKSAYQMALLGAHREVAELLTQHGALAEPLTGVDAFAAAARASNRALAAELLAGHPEYLLDVEPLLQAAQAGDAAGVRLLLELGMNPNGQGKHGHRALNDGCNHRDVVEALWEHGAEPGARCFGATPAQWALHAGNLEMARLHAERSRSVFDAVVTGHVDLTRRLLAEDPARAKERTPSGNTPLHELPDDPATAELLLELLLERGADRAATNDAGQTPTQLLEERGRDVVATLLESA